MKDQPIINAGLAPGELFIIPAPGSPMVILPAARYMARYEVMGRGEGWMACRIQEASLDSQQHKIVERIATFAQRDQALAFVEHMAGLLMATGEVDGEDDRPGQTGRVIRPERGLKAIFMALLVLAGLGLAAFVMM